MSGLLYGEWHDGKEELRRRRRLALYLLAEEEKIQQHEVRDGQLKEKLDEVNRIVIPLTSEELPQLIKRIDGQLKAEVAEINRMVTQYMSKIPQLMKCIQENDVSLAELEYEHNAGKHWGMGEMEELMKWLKDTVVCKNAKDVKALAFLSRVTAIKKGVSVARKCDVMEEIVACAEQLGLAVQIFTPPEMVEESSAGEKKKMKFAREEENQRSLDEADTWTCATFAPALILN